MEAGEFDRLEGAGRPVNLDAYFSTPEELRAGYAVLKNAGVVPERPPAGRTPRDGRAAGASAARAEADALAAQRRVQAVSLLTSLADEARDFRDETVRARAQARAADALWETDAQLARALFR